MSLQTLPSVILYPGRSNTNNSTGTFTASSTLDASGEYVAYMGYAIEDMVVSHVGIRTHTATGSPTVEIRIETVDGTTGLPTGTLWATNTNVTTGTLTASDFSVHALTASATISKGSYYAVKILYATGTTFALSRFTAAMASQSILPYQVLNTGTPTKADFGVLTYCMALGSSSSVFYKIPRMLPVTATAVGLSASTATFDAVGVRFKVPFKCRCAGFLHTTASATAGPFTYGIYNDAGSEVSSSSTSWLDMDIPVTPGVYSMMSLYFDNPVELSPDTWYRLALWPTSATSITLIGFEYDSAGLQAAGPGGVNWHLTKKALAGAWDDSNTLVGIHTSLILDQLDDGVGSGGGTYFSVGG